MFYHFIKFEKYRCVWNGRIKHQFVWIFVNKICVFVHCDILWYCYTSFAFLLFEQVTNVQLSVLLSLLLLLLLLLHLLLPLLLLLPTTTTAAAAASNNNINHNTTTELYHLGLQIWLHTACKTLLSHISVITPEIAVRSQTVRWRTGGAETCWCSCPVLNVHRKY